ncbi:MAG TPA: response regulator transcription factor, partial [Ilumatobacter sp.]
EAPDGESALARFAGGLFDVALIDLKLPGQSGFDVCRAIRAVSDLPIVIVTAQVDSYDVVAGLEAGADDYVTKPFVPKVLTARIRALLRRAQGGSGETERWSFGDVEISPREGTVTKRSVPVHLTKTEFLLLCDLAQHRSQVMSRELLLERVWGYDYAGDGRLVDSHIRRLRQKIERDPDRPSLIVTVRGLGYKLSPP